MTALTIKVDATAIFEDIPPLIRRNVSEPSVTPKPAGSIVIDPAMVEKAYIKVDQSTAIERSKFMSIK